MTGVQDSAVMDVEDVGEATVVLFYHSWRNRQRGCCCSSNGRWVSYIYGGNSWFGDWRDCTADRWPVCPMRQMSSTVIV